MDVTPMSDPLPTVDCMAEKKHPDCPQCDCPSSDVHCKHARNPWFGLTDDELAILDFEAQHWNHPGAKEQAILDQFGWKAARYYQVLNALLDRPEALAYSPLLVRRLLRLRDARVAARAAR